jgi:hypothetical protein
MIITIVLGITCIALGAISATKAPARISNYNTISIKGEPQANITIKGYIGTNSENPGQRYLYRAGSLTNEENTQYVSLDEYRKIAVDFSNAPVLKYIDGRNPPKFDTWSGLQANFSTQTRESYIAYQITIECLYSTNIRVNFVASTFQKVKDQLRREIMIRSGDTNVPLPENSISPSAPLDLYMGQTATIEILIKVDKPLSELYSSDIYGRGNETVFNFAIEVQKWDF